MNRRSFVTTVIAFLSVVVMPFRRVMATQQQALLRVRRYRWITNQRPDGNVYSIPFILVYGPKQFMEAFLAAMPNSETEFPGERGWYVAKLPSGEDFEILAHPNGRCVGERFYDEAFEEVIMPAIHKAKSPHVSIEDWRDYQQYSKIEEFLDHSDGRKHQLKVAT